MRQRRAATTLTNGTTNGGSWASYNTAIAPVAAATGSVAGVYAGTAAISYIMTTGCKVGKVVTINPLPAAKL